MGLPLQADVEMTFMEWKHADSPIMKKILRAAASKESHAANLLGH